MYNGNYIQLTFNGQDLLGSSAVCPTDGRLGVDKLFEQGLQRIQSENKFKGADWSNGFKIFKKNKMIKMNKLNEKLDES